MVFSTLEFLFLYLVVSVGVYYVCPRKWRNIWLLLISLVFYGWGEPLYVFLMIFTVVMDYVFGYLVSKRKDDRAKAKMILIIAVAANLLILGFFKYYDFIVGDVLGLIPGVNIPKLGIPLPIGISFYTFQALSYVIDVYRGDAPAQKKITSFGAYVTLFPQLIAGPIVRYKDIDKQLNGRRETVTLFASGVRTFVCGLCKKVLLANTAGQMWESIKATPEGERTVVSAWFGILLFSLQLYFDFSGYSDMAVGIGKMLGFRFLENFNYPYIAKSVTDFWRRWHISLSTWFRDNVYIPLGGSHTTKFKTFRNLLITWLLTGFWHGAYWNYIFWGIYYGIILILEKAFLKKLLCKLPAALTRIYTLSVVLFGWLIFVFENTKDGFAYFLNMFGKNAPAFADTGDGYVLLYNAVFIAIMIFAVTPLPKKLFYSLYFSSGTPGKIFRIASAVLTLGAVVLCTAYLVDGKFNPFLYFRF